MTSTCVAGFDPFGEHDATFLAHISGCPHCRDVVRVLETGTRVWREEQTSDDARAVFRERRLVTGKTRRPVRTATLSIALLAALWVTSAWAFGRISRLWEERGERSSTTVGPAKAEGSTHAIVSEPPRTEPPRAPEPPASTPPEPALVAQQLALRPSASSRAHDPTPTELWERGVSSLEHGDRPGAVALFQQVIDAPTATPSLRRRATFRWAEVLLASGDTVTPRPSLSLLLRGPDATLGFDAALLLERCEPAPDDRARIWEAYLATGPAEPLRTQAEQRRNAALLP
jgi:hypothetical protein